MVKNFPSKFHIVPSLTPIVLVLTAILICQDLWASQAAIVTAEEAVIYADKQMSAPVGYVRKGKKIRVGSVSRNRAQVYPIVVSGKLAYIRVIDVSTAREISGETNLVTERFRNMTKEKLETNYSFSVFNYATQISLNKENDKLKDKDPVNWYGVGVRGGAVISPYWDLDLLANVMMADAKQESFRMVEFGAGVSAKVIETGRFKFKVGLQGLAVPFASYAFKQDFRVNGYGFSTGGGANMSYRFSKHLGMEGYGGFYYTKISSFSPPQPYNEISPSFMGTRLGVGVNYEF